MEHCLLAITTANQCCGRCLGSRTTRVRPMDQRTRSLPPAPLLVLRHHAAYTHSPPARRSCAPQNRDSLHPGQSVALHVAFHRVLMRRWCSRPARVQAWARSSTFTPSCPRALRPRPLCGASRRDSSTARTRRGRRCCGGSSASLGWATPLTTRVRHDLSCLLMNTDSCADVQCT